MRPLEELRDEIIQQIKVNNQKALFYEIADSLRLSGDWEINESFFSN